MYEIKIILILLETTKDIIKYLPKLISINNASK